MSVRSRVNVYAADGSKAGAVDMPTVFGVMHRADVVEAVAQRANMITRKAYAVSDFAGYQTAAASWGTGRAVARVPRVPGGGSHRSGQAAFANFCRGGGMFAPTKTYRKWTRQTNKTERRHAQAFAVSAAGCTSLVIARGHKVEQVPEFPLVVSDSIESVTKTSELKKFLAAVGAAEDMKRCVDNKKIRAGQGKNRNRKYKKARGPLIVACNGENLNKCAKTVAGLDTTTVECLNIRELAPGGKGGRFMIFTESAFAKLNEVFGNEEGVSMVKTGYKLPRSVITGDVNKVIRSEQVQSVIRPTMVSTIENTRGVRVNPLRNKKAMAKITPKMDGIKAIRMEKLK